jgi:hypothetical protein
MNNIQIKINDKVLLNDDAKQFIDYLSESIVNKHNKAITKRNIYGMVYKIALFYLVLRFFPEIFNQVFN